MFIKGLETNHGSISLPAFMPVATRGAVRNVSSAELVAVGAEVILSNTYHLMQRPGIKVVKQAGGLHQFMNWSGPILTDSGGYQVLSLAKFRKLSDQGVEFRSEIDGRRIYLTPENVIEAQRDLGVDIAMVLDVDIAHPSTRQEAEQSVRLTSEWAKRARQIKLNPGQKMFGIIQG